MMEAPWQKRPWFWEPNLGGENDKSRNGMKKKSMIEDHKKKKSKAKKKENKADHDRLYEGFWEWIMQ